MSAHEYLPDDKPQKKFNIVPAQDEEQSETNIAIRLSRECRHSNKVGEGPKVLFEELKDLWFWPKVRDNQGAVVMSKPKLSERLQVSAKTIARWKEELEANRFIWTKTFFKAGFELTRWFIRGLSNSQNELFSDNWTDPSFGRSRPGKSRRKFQQGTNGQFCPKTKNTEKPAKSAGNGQNCPSTMDSSVPWPGTDLSVDHGQNCPSPRDSSVRHQGTDLSIPKGQICPNPTDKTVHGQGTELSELSSASSINQGEVPSKRLSKRAGAAVSVNGLTPRERDSENDFLEHCRQVLGDKEMEENGALWRTLFRQNKQKCWACLNETRSMARESRIKTTAARTMMNLWTKDHLRYDKKGAAA